MQAPTVSVELRGAATTVASLRGREGINEHYDFDLSLVGTEPFEHSPLGEQATVRLASADGGVRALVGVVTEAGLVDIDGKGTERVFHHRVRVRPAAWRLTQRRTSRIFQDVTLRQVVDAVFEEHAVELRWLDIGDDTIREYVVQYEETDWELVSRLWAEAGLFFFFEDKAGAPDVLVIASRAADYPSTDIALPYREEGSGLKGGDAMVTMALQEALRPEQVVVRGFDFRQPLRTIHHEARTPTAPRGGDATRREQFFHHTHFEDRLEDSVAALAEVQLEQHRRDALVAKATSTCPVLRPGYSFDVTDHPLPACNRRWVVTAIEHRTSLDEPDYRAHVRAVPVEVPYRPAVPPRKVVQVAESATVIGPEGATIHTDELGRVKIRFHWDRRSLHPDHASCWVRVMHQWAGSTIGERTPTKEGEGSLQDPLRE